jgi:nitric oxide reductase large subunit
MRWSMLGSASESKDLTFLAVVIAWLTVTFISFGLFAPRTMTVVGSFLVAALAVAAAVFLILELNTPLSGLIMISGDPLRFALAHLGQ